MKKLFLGLVVMLFTLTMSASNNFSNGPLQVNKFKELYKDKAITSISVEIANQLTNQTTTLKFNDLKDVEAFDFSKLVPDSEPCTITTTITVEGEVSVGIAGTGGKVKVSASITFTTSCTGLVAAIKAKTKELKEALGL